MTSDQTNCALALGLVGPLIPATLDDIADRIHAAGYLLGLSRTEFADQAADIMADLNAVHPFREGNGRTQRHFMRELATQAGHTLDFRVISKERMIAASIAANEHQDKSVMRRLFHDASDPARITALREAIESLAKHGFPWNDRYIATAEPGHSIEAVFVGRSGDHFMARTNDYQPKITGSDREPVRRRASRIAGDIGVVSTHIPGARSRMTAIHTSRPL